MKTSRFGLASLIIGYVFLYTPLISLVMFSFNSSKQVIFWTGFSMKWYKALFMNSEILNATLTSLEIAAITATGATILGAISAIIILKFKKFRGKNLFEVLVSLPLIMPEVIMGLGLLLLFFNLESWFGWPRIGTKSAITFAHTTLSISYVCAIVHAQLVSFDETLLEAAMDLGARPIKAFFQIMIPFLMPSLISGWFLSFVLSMDDLIVASFVGGPEATTLPMLIYSSVKFGVTPQINALASLIILFVMSILTIGYFFHMRQKKSLEAITSSPSQ